MKLVTRWISLHAVVLLYLMLIGPAAAFGAEPVVISAGTPLASSSVISLDPAPHAANASPVKGEGSFANLPANFHVFAAVRAGETVSPEVLTLRFAAATELVSIRSTADFPLQAGGSCTAGTAYAAGASCTLMVEFTPQGAGRRLGKLTVTHTASDGAFEIGLVGYGYAPVVSFVPALISTVPGTYPSSVGLLSGAQNLTVAGDVVYVADTGNDVIREIDSSGITTITVFLSGSTPASVAVDSLGIVYSINTPGSYYYFTEYFPWDSQTYYPYSYVPGTCTVSSPCAFSAVGMSGPAQLNIDGNDNLFMEEKTKGALEMPVADVESGGTLNLWYLSDTFAYDSGSAATFAVDPSDNLYTYYSFSPPTVCYIVEEPLYGAESTPSFTRVAGAAKCGFSGDGGQARNAEIGATVGQMAFDLAGNLYFSDSSNQRVRRIDASTGIIRTIAGTGVAGYTGDLSASTTAELSSPTGVGVDSQGQVYIISSAATGQVVRKLGPNGYLSLGGVNTGSSSAAHMVTLSNTGNSDLQVTNAVFTGTNPGDFKVDPNTTSCDLTSGGLLAAGQTCTVGVIFTPAATGKRLANLVFNDNTVTNDNTVQLVGTGQVPAALAITSPAAASSFPSGAAVTFAVRATSAAPAPTGNIRFFLDGKQIDSPVVLSLGAASVRLTAASVGTHTLSALYGGDALHAPAGPVTRTLTVTGAATLPVTTR